MTPASASSPSSTPASTVVAARRTANPARTTARPRPAGRLSHRRTEGAPATPGQQG